MTVDLEAQAKALREHLGRSGSGGEVSPGSQAGTFQVAYTLPARPLVSIIIANKDHVDMLARCVRSIRQSSYESYEIILVENGSRQPETFAYYQELERDKNIHIVNWKAPFNYSGINNFGVKQSAGEVLLFLNNDMQVINPDWLERMLEHALRSPVGAVGAMLYYPDDTVQHAGMAMCQRTVFHVHRFAPRGSSGYANRLATVHNCSMVTGACLMMRQLVFDEVEGFDEGYAILYNDADLCMKIRHKGYQIVWTPHAQLYHFESVSRGYEGMYHHEYARFADRWGEQLEKGDPYFSPHLQITGSDVTIRAA
jgi:GT2 family glycosyltransferase